MDSELANIKINHIFWDEDSPLLNQSDPCLPTNSLFWLLGLSLNTEFPFIMARFLVVYFIQ